MAWVETTEDWRQVPRRLIKSLVVIVVAGVAFGYAIGLLLARGFESLPIEKLGNQSSGQEEEGPDSVGILRP